MGVGGKASMISKTKTLLGFERRHKSGTGSWSSKATKSNSSKNRNFGPDETRVRSSEDYKRMARRE